MITFKKTTPTCSNIYMIDQDLCLANSLNLIKYNFNSLNYSISYLNSFRAAWYNLYTKTVSNSAIWIKTATNIQSYSAIWLDTSATVTALSSTWSKPYTFYYPNMIDISTWYGSTTQSKNTILNWLNANFNPKKYAINQNIYINLYLTQQQPFSFKFERSLNESCTPNGGGLSLSCNGCPLPHRGCNHHGGAAGYGPCTNAYAGCRRSYTSSGANVTCVGTGGKMLKVGLNRVAYDNNIARTITLVAKNTNRVWSIL